MPAGAGAEDAEAGHLAVIGQQPEGMPAVGVADDVQRHGAIRHGVDRRGQVQPRPIQEIRAQSMEGRRTRLPDAPVIERQGFEATGAGELGEPPVEPLRHRCRSRNDQAPLQRRVGRIAAAAEDIPVGGGETHGKGVSVHGASFYNDCHRRRTLNYDDCLNKG